MRELDIFVLYWHRLFWCAILILGVLFSVYYFQQLGGTLARGYIPSFFMFAVLPAMAISYSIAHMLTVVKHNFVILLASGAATYTKDRNKIMFWVMAIIQGFLAPIGIAIFAVPFQ